MRSIDPGTGQDRIPVQSSEFRTVTRGTEGVSASGVLNIESYWLEHLHGSFSNVPQANIPVKHHFNAAGILKQWTQDGVVRVVDITKTPAEYFDDVPRKVMYRKILVYGN